MPLPTLTAIPLEVLAPWLLIAGFGAYQGINPGGGWLFALALLFVGGLAFFTAPSHAPYLYP